MAEYENENSRSSSSSNRYENCQNGIIYSIWLHVRLSKCCSGRSACGVSRTFILCIRSPIARSPRIPQKKPKWTANDSKCAASQPASRPAKLVANNLCAIKNPKWKKWSEEEILIDFLVKKLKKKNNIWFRAYAIVVRRIAYSGSIGCR